MTTARAFFPQADSSAHDERDDVEVGSSCVYTLCPINTKLAETWSSKLAMRHLKHGRHSWGSILFEQTRRVVPRSALADSTFLAAVRDRWSLGRLGVHIDMPGNLEVSPDVDGIDDSLSHERGGVQYLRGLSCFALPKPIRQILRVDVGLLECDIVNSHPVHMLTLVPPDRRHVFEALRHYVEHRDEVLRDLGLEVGAGRDTMKTVLLGVCYGGGPAKLLLELTGFKGRVPALIKDLSREVGDVAAHVASMYPVQFEALKVELAAREARRSSASAPGASAEARFLAHRLAMLQRETLEHMGRLLPSSAVSYERDALVVCEPRLDVMGISAALGMQVKVSPYPDEAAVHAVLQEKFPFMDFGIVSRITSAELNAAEHCCTRALQPDKKGNFPTPQNSTDFGVVVAASLEPYLICASGKKVEHWERAAAGGFGKWHVSDDAPKLLARCTRNAMLAIFRGSGSVWDKGKVFGVPRGTVPPPCKRKDFYSSVAADVALVLYRTEPAGRLDGLDQRRFLMDKRGLIYDHIDDRFIYDNPFIRVSLGMAWRFFKGDEVGEKGAPQSSQLSSLVVFAECMGRNGHFSRHFGCHPVVTGVIIRLWGDARL